MKQKWLIFALISWFLIPVSAYAVIPPDFVFNISSQIAQIFGFTAIVLGTLFSTSYQYIKNKFADFKFTRLFIILAIVFTLIVSGSIAYFYSKNKQKSEYDKWLQESSQNNTASEKVNTAEVAPEKTETLAVVVEPVPETQAPAIQSFFDQNKAANLMITNTQFKDILAQDESEYFVLDAREDLEYQNGFFPNSTHIRFADLSAGRYSEVPTDRFVIVLCWSGIRGKEVAEFLRSKSIVAQYLEKGADGWVADGGTWSGNIKWAQKYTEARYTLLFETDQVKSKVAEGVVLVDCREPSRYKTSHITNSINLPIMYTPTIDLEKAFAQVPAKSRVITVCDGYVNCFDAKITGVELENRGYEFLGRYNKPWDYGN
jgi:rhodanese-related sulfurtransferase